MATIEETFDVVCKTFRISALNAPQKKKRNYENSGRKKGCFY